MNPFSLSFGQEPQNVISRDKQISDIVTGLTTDNPAFHVCMITGVRGSGKTVLMTEVTAAIKREKGWIVVELSPERDLIHALAAELSNRTDLLQIFKDAKLNLSFLGLGVEIDAEPPITDIVIALDRMLAGLTKRGKKILVSVDEVVPNQNIREFASQLQIYLRKKYDLFMVMTGLYEKIYELQNEDTLTFLYRAPKFAMAPLNSVLVAKEYRKIFDISDEEAQKMAETVQGYPYAYQVLGYLCYKNKCAYMETIDEFKAYLGEYVYDKVWSELSPNDRVAIFALAKSKDGKIADVRDIADMSSGEFSVYRERLLKKGIVQVGQYGYLSFALPCFREYVLDKNA